jgi:pimeloyl-ACP methyl ester carboxylesterase
MAERTALTVSANDGTILAGERWSGTGPVVVFLHAGVTDRRSWNQVASELTPSVRPTTYDRRGFGQTPVSGTAFSHVADLLAVLDAVADGPAWLVGSSMGGGLALDAALVAPERVAGLVLIAPAVSGITEFDMDPDTARLEGLVEEAINEGNVAEANRFETWLWLDGPAQPEGRVGGSARSLALEMNEIIIRNDAPEEAGASGVDAWNRLDEVRPAATVACGDLDVPFLGTLSRQLAERVPNGRFVELTGVAHLPQLENPTAVSALVREACLGSR